MGPCWYVDKARVHARYGYYEADLTAYSQWARTGHDVA